MLWPYFIPIFLISFIQFTYISEIRESDKKQFVFAVLVILFFAGTRGNSSGDYTNYITYGKEIKTFADVIHRPGFPLEMGYRFFAWIVNSFNLPTQTVIFAMNAISIGCIFKAIKKYSSDIRLSLLLFLPFFYQYDMHAARTASAIGIITLSIGYIIEKKLFKFAVIVFLGSLFHKEALIIFPLYFAWNFNISILVGLAVLLFELAFVRFIGIKSVVNWGLSVAHLDGLQYKFNHYITGNYTAFTYPTRILDPRNIIATLIWVWGKKTLVSPNKYEKFLINSSFFTIFVMVFFGEYTFFYDRLSAFYNIFSIFLIPSIIHSYNRYYSMGERLLERKVNYKYPVVLFYMVYSCAYAIRLWMSQPYKFFTLAFWN